MPNILDVIKTEGGVILRMTSDMGNLNEMKVGTNVLTIAASNTTHMLSFQFGGTNYAVDTSVTTIKFNGSTVTGTTAEIKTSIDTSLAAGSEVTTGGLALESYQNSAMTTPVQAYVFRDADDNIVRVYEPVRNNDVSRFTFAYEDSIDKFLFDSVDCFNSSLRDVKLADIAGDIKVKNCILGNLFIDGGGFNGLQLLNHNHKGINGADGAEIDCKGNNITFMNISTCAGKFSKIGTGSTIYMSTFGQFSAVNFYGRKAVIQNIAMFDLARLEIPINDSIVGDSITMFSESVLIVGGRPFDLTLHPSAYVGYDYNIPQQTISNTNQGAKTFTITGNHADDVKRIVFIQFGDNQGYYTVVSATNAEGDTEILVEEDIPSASSVGGYMLLISLFKDVQYSEVKTNAMLFSSGDDIDFMYGEISHGIAYSPTANKEKVTVTNSARIYSCKLTQSGASDPVAVVLENTLDGDITWVRNDLGVYKGTLAGIFPIGKTYAAGFGTWDGNANPYFPLLDGAALVGYYSVSFDGEDSIVLEIHDAAGAAAEFSAILGGTVLFLPEIKVYP